MSLPAPEQPASEAQLKPPALEVCGVSHSYGERKALADASFSVPAGQFTVLLGLNGAGKSTLFCLITRLFAARQGMIRIFGYDVNRTPGEALRRLGAVFQTRTLDLDLTVSQNLAYHAALHGIGSREAKARINLVLQKVGMAGRAHDTVRALSGGEVRRIEIARALLHKPRMLLLDEPTVGLDIKARAGILAHVRSLVAREGIGVLWATHLIDEVEPEDGIIVLHRGRVLDKGRASKISERAGAPAIGPAFAKLTSAASREEKG
jgi:ABC-2 type transport system ATP-binding protein